MITTRIKQIGHCFEDEASFLIGYHGDTAVPAGLAIMIEFELDPAFLPVDEKSDICDPANASAWRDTLCFHSPALIHIADGLADLAIPASCIFNLDACYGGGYSVILPIEASKHYRTIHNLIFQNNLPFPPSRHAQIAASGASTGTAWTDLSLRLSCPTAGAPAFGFCRAFTAYIFSSRSILK